MKKYPYTIMGGLEGAARYDIWMGCGSEKENARYVAPKETPAMVYM